MQTAIGPSDRRLLFLAGLAFLALIGSVAFLTPPAGERDDAVPSSYSSAPNGARAAYLLLQDLGLPVRRWADSCVDLPPDSSGSVLVLADPSGAPNAEERGALLRFVKDGGTVLFTGPSLSDFFPDAHLLTQRPNAKEQSFPAIFPGAFTRNAASVDLVPEATWERADDGAAVPLYGDSRMPVAVSWRLEAGRVLWWAGSAPLTNTGVVKKQNLNLVLNAVGASGAHGPTTIYWDEYFHGERQSLWAYLRNTPVFWGLAQIAMLGAAVFFTFARRSGPLRPETQAPRLWPLEFVDTLGALYQRAQATTAAVGVVYQTFRTELTRRFQLPPTISDASLGQAVEKRLGWYRPGLPRTLERAAAASRGEELKPAEALELVQELEYYRRQFGLGKPEEVRRP